jgi:hypothetical protein
MSRFFLVRVIALVSLFMLAAPAVQADAPINANIKEALYHLPIPGIQKALDDLFKALKQGENGGYAAKTTVDVPGVGKFPLQLYFFGKNEKQALLLVVDRTIAIPKVFNNRAWKQLAGASMSDPIFSLSTVDFTLTAKDMPADFKKVVADSYYNVQALQFTSGFQVAARLKLAGQMKGILEKGLNFPATDFTMRAGVVIPVPTDAAGSAALAAQLAADMKNIDKVLKDQPDFFVELQPKPGTKVGGLMGMGGVTLTDPTVSLNSKLTLGFKGNVITGGTTYITFFETPLTPEGAMDLADFQFGFATQTMTFEQMSSLAMSLQTPQVKGGSFIKGIDKYRDQLQKYLNALKVFEIRNPNTVGTYKFGDPNHPFPPKGVFNVVVMGPFASMTDSNGKTIQGPYLSAMGDARVLQQKMGSVRLTIGDSGLHGLMTAGLKLNMGPLGKTGITMRASADIDSKTQQLLMHGNVLGRTLDVSLDPYKLSIDSPATCATPFSLTEKLNITPILDVSGLMDALPGVNVDPSKLSNCIGEELEKAYKWVSSTGKALGGFTANQANAELKKIDDAAAAAEKAAQEAYNKAKDKARDAANKATHEAANAFKDAGNAFKRLGKKKKHKKGPDPKFAASVFDWDYYYDHAQDVVKAKVDLSQHWRDHGFNEGRQGSLLFTAKYYLNRYSDVKGACGNNLQCALQHWLDEGIEEGRQGSADFSAYDYMSRYPDLQRAFGRENYPDAIEHWLNNGEDEGRNGKPASTPSGLLAGSWLVGGDGGSPWSDLDVACAPGQYVTGFKLNTSKYVDSVQFQYNYSKWGEVHGKPGTSKLADAMHGQKRKPGPDVEVVLNPGEYVVRVDYRSGSMLDAIGFVTNQKRTLGPYGGGGGGSHSYRVTTGEKLGCMYGRAGNSVDRIVLTSTGLR